MVPNKFNKDGKCGLSDAHGKVIVPAIYDFIFPFVDGFAVVSNGSFFNGEKGVVNIEGKEIIPVKHRKIHFLSEGHFLVYKTYSICAFFDTAGKQVSEDLEPSGHNGITSLKEGLARLELNYQEYVFIDVTGKQTIAESFYTAGLFCDGLARVQSSTLWGFIDKKGDYIIPPKYSYVQSFNENLAAVAITTPNDKKSWGYINTKGEEVVAPQYENVSCFHRGRALVCKSLGNYQYAYLLIDTTGEVVEELDGHFYMDGYNFSIIAERNGKFGIISTHNEALLPFEYDAIRHEFCGMRIVKKDGFEGMIDMDNRVIVPLIYTKVEASSASGVHDESVTVSYYSDEYYFEQNNMHTTTINVERGGKWGGFPYISNNNMYYSQDFIPAAYARKSLVDDIGRYYVENGCSFPILDILQKLQSTDKKEASFGKDLLKTVNFLMETNQVHGIAIDTDIVLPIAIAWATSSLMNERIMSTHLIKALFLQIKNNKTPLIALDYKIYHAFQVATAKKPFPLEDVFEIIVPDYGFTNLFYPFVTNAENYKAFVDTDLSVKFLDDDSNILTKIPKGTDKALEKMFKEVTKTYSALQPIALQQFAQHKTQGKTWSAQDWNALFLSNPFYFNLALTVNWKTQNDLFFAVQEDQSLLDATMEEVEIADTDWVGLA